MTARRALVAVVALTVLVIVVVRAIEPGSPDDEPNVVTVFGPLLGAEADALAAVFDEFTATTGIDVRYTASADFEQDLLARVASGNPPPDIALIPQPGLIDELIALEAITGLSDAVADAVRGDFPDGELIIGSDGTVYAAAYTTSVKSLVWYRPEVFDERGWSRPETLDELAALVDSIDDDAELAPWCFSIFSGSATGWPATDWVEDLVLRRHGSETYDALVSGQLGYDSAEVREALDEYGELVLAPGRVNGGTSFILETRVQETNRPLFDDDGCALYKQASFATAWFPDDTTIGPDGDLDFFVLPGVDADDPAPLLRAAQFLTPFSARPEVDALMRFLASPAGSEPWRARGGFVSDRTSLTAADYPQPDRQFVALLDENRTSRFDASDHLAFDPRAVLLDELTRHAAGVAVEQLDLEGIDQLRTNHHPRP